MKSMSLKLKIVLLCTFIITQALVISGVGLWQLDKVEKDYLYLTKVSLPNLVRITNLDLTQKEIFAKTLLSISKNKVETVEIYKDVQILISQYEHQNQSYADQVGEQEVYKVANNDWLVFKKNVQDAFNKDIVFDLQKLELSSNAFSLSQQKLRVLQNIETNQWNDRAQAQVEKSFYTQIGSLFVLIFVSGFLSIWLSNSLVKMITRVVDELSKTSEQVSTAAAQIATTSESLSQATTEQAASLVQTVTSVDEMNSMVVKNTENAEGAALTSTNSQDLANNGKSAVEKMTVSMSEINQSNQDIMEQINQSNVKMAEIVKVIQEIGNKTKVINDIVFQTKLLSFNASVEAARAGEHGRGFAVVATEVGNLARMSGSAAKEISTMLDSSVLRVEDIAKETKSRVEMFISSGRQKVENGVQVARQCGEILNDIVSGISNVTVMANDIASASREQAAGISEINKAMGQLDQVTQQNASSGQQAAVAADRLSNQVRALKNCVESLEEAVNGKTLVKNFSYKPVEVPHKVLSKTKIQKPKAAAAKLLKADAFKVNQIKTDNNVVHFDLKKKIKMPLSTPAVNTGFKMVAGEKGVPNRNDPGFGNLD